MNAIQKITLLERLLNEAKDLNVPDSDDPAFKAWRHSLERALVRIYGEKSNEVKHFRGLRFFYQAFMMSLGSDYSQEHRKAFRRDMEIAVRTIQSYVDELKRDQDSSSEHEASGAKRPSGNNVFIIHGRDLVFAEAVARFVVKRGLEDVILHEQPNKGRTIIEKFEQHALPCAFAIAIFTGDDEGRLRNGDNPLQPRARQNVVLELGYFVGALGRDRVAVLHHPDVELPSDFDGVLYIPINGDWRGKLGQELDAAGIGLAVAGAGEDT